MADLRERLRAAAGDIAAPDLWRDIEHRTPRQAPPRRSTGRVLAVASSVLIAAAGIALLVLMFRSGPQATEVPGNAQNGEIAFSRFPCMGEGICREPAQLWVADADGENAPRHLLEGVQPDWSLDGTSLVFVRNPGRLFAASADGSDVRPLIECRPPCESDSLPSWSPDGTQIAFIRANRPGGPTSEPFSELYLVSSAGGEPRRLHVCPHPECSGDSFPEWSPNGTQIAFESFVKDPDGNSEHPYISVIELFDLRTGHVRTIARGGDTGLAWSPDGRFLVITRGPSLAVIDAATGSDVRRLTTCRGAGSCYDIYPEWSPDGDWIIFNRSAEAGRQSSLLLIHPDGTGLHPLFDSEGEGGFLAAWQPVPAMSPSPSV